MSRSARQSVPLPPGPHGRPVPYFCRCGARTAAYPGKVPAGWENLGRVWRCPGCVLQRRRAAGVTP